MKCERFVTAVHVDLVAVCWISPLNHGVTRGPCLQYFVHSELHIHEYNFTKLHHYVLKLARTYPSSNTWLLRSVFPCFHPAMYLAMWWDWSQVWGSLLGGSLFLPAVSLTSCRSISVATDHSRGTYMVPLMCPGAA